MKTCTICQEEKALSSFRTEKSSKGDYTRNQCNPCRANQRRSRYSEDELYRQRILAAQKARGFRLARYKMSEAEYDQRLLDQDYRCGLCENKADKLAVDHDHACCPGHKNSCGGCIRDLLCRNCNLGLGYFKDNPVLLSAAIDYLKKHGIS